MADRCPWCREPKESQWGCGRCSGYPDRIAKLEAALKRIADNRPCLQRDEEIAREAWKP